MHITLALLFLPAVLSAPLIKHKRATDVIPGKYIVKFQGDVTTLADQQIKASIANTPDFEYSIRGFRGFAGTLSPNELSTLRASPTVEYIQEDARVHTAALLTQAGAPWGLGRISHREKNITDYVYDETAGTGTCAYVIDTGIYVEHPEFEGRAQFLKDFSGENTLKDGEGHGTHVAGTIGSKTYGVAKNTKLFAVKVLDSYGSGTWSSVLAGINFVVTDAAQRKEQCPNGVVANMSLGGSLNTAINDASKALVSSGVFLAVAAGNSGDDSKYYSPASEPTVCTVGATDINDKIPYFSNYGPGVDIYAPGVDILSTWNDGATDIISGTSMASPHVAGLGAYVLGLGGSSTAGLCERLVTLATKGVISGLPNGTANALAFNGAIA